MLRPFKISTKITNRDSPAVEKYLGEVAKIPRITPDEEVMLAQQIKTGDKRALDKLINANLRFVVSVAKQFQGNGHPLSDLINYGNLGLAKAAKRFDETKGFKFASYAVWWIRQAILQGIAEEGKMIRAPLNKQALRRKKEKVTDIFIQEHEYEPGPEDIAEALNITSEKAWELEEINKFHDSLDGPFSDDEAHTMLDVLEDDSFEPLDQALKQEDLIKNIREVIKHPSLTDQEKNVLAAYFGIGRDYPMSLEDIADEYCLTRERVRQIKDSAVKKLQKPQIKKFLLKAVA